MAFYNGEPFRMKGMVTAIADGKCPTCREWWDAGDRIRACEKDPYGDNDWFHMHDECARDHSMRVKGKGAQQPVTQAVKEPIKEEFEWIYGRATDSDRFVRDNEPASVVAEFDSHRPRDRKYRYRVL